MQRKKKKEIRPHLGDFLRDATSEQVKQAGDRIFCCFFLVLFLIFSSLENSNHAHKNNIAPLNMKQTVGEKNDCFEKSYSKRRKFLIKTDKYKYKFKSNIIFHLALFKFAIHRHS